MPFQTPFDSDALTVVLKLPGDVCDIDCHYCYEKRKTDSKFAVISPDTLIHFLSKFSDRYLNILFHGGEPLVLGRKKLSVLFDVVKKHHGRYSLFLQTNLIKIDLDWVNFFKFEYPEVTLSTSIDGGRTGNGQRVSYTGEEIFDRLKENLDLLRANGMKIGNVATINKLSIGNELEDFKFFNSYKDVFNLVKLNPCFDYADGKFSEWAISPDEYGIYLKNIFEEWVNSGEYSNLLIEPFVSVIRKLGGTDSEYCTFNSQKCAHYLTLYPDGRITSCDVLLHKDSALSNVRSLDTSNQILSLEVNRNLYNISKALMDHCGTCDYEDTCGGGCIATRKNFFGSDEYFKYCEYRINLIDMVSNMVT
jgi:uncharacterized protein